MLVKIAMSLFTPDCFMRLSTPIERYTYIAERDPSPQPGQ